MNADYYYVDECSVRYALSILHGKWRLPIIWELTKKDKLRFGELQNNLEGISAIALSKELKALQDLKLVVRETLPSQNNYVAYTLTSLGHQLRPAIMSLGEWGEKMRQDWTDV